MVIRRIFGSALAAAALAGGVGLVGAPKLQDGAGVCFGSGLVDRDGGRSVGQ
jgi:hypothetical protein